MDEAAKSLADLLAVATKRHCGASGRRLADLAQNAGHDISHATLNRLRAGTYSSRPTDASIRAIAYLAGVPEAVAFAAAGFRDHLVEPYQPPVEAHRMTTRQRRAFDELLRSFSAETAPAPIPGLGALLVSRNDLSDALASAEAQTPPEVLAAARAVIAAVDDATRAMTDSAPDYLRPAQR